MSQLEVKMAPKKMSDELRDFLVQQHVEVASRGSGSIDTDEAVAQRVADYSGSEDIQPLNPYPLIISNDPSFKTCWAEDDLQFNVGDRVAFLQPDSEPGPHGSVSSVDSSRGLVWVRFDDFPGRAEPCQFSRLLPEDVCPEKKK